MTDNGTGLPPEWPVKANPCQKDDQPPERWIKMTDKQLDALKAKYQGEYDAWKEAKKAEERKREENEKKAREAPAKQAQSRLKLLQFTEDEIKKIMGANYCE